MVGTVLDQLQGRVGCGGEGGGREGGGRGWGRQRRREGEREGGREGGRQGKQKEKDDCASSVQLVYMCMYVLAAMAPPTPKVEGAEGLQCQRHAADVCLEDDALCGCGREGGGGDLGGSWVAQLLVQEDHVQHPQQPICEGGGCEGGGGEEGGGGR